eukprot:175909-Pyramimonas_sp.AAC.1
MPHGLPRLPSPRSPRVPPTSGLAPPWARAVSCGVRTVCMGARSRVRTAPLRQVFVMIVSRLDGPVLRDLGHVPVTIPVSNGTVITVCIRCCSCAAHSHVRGLAK